MPMPGFVDWNPPAYGVCDGHEQFMRKFGKILEDDERTFCVGFSHCAKEPGVQGWRWHKWGEYIGEGEPECEYLADEEGFEDGVWGFFILQIDGPNHNIGSGMFPFHKDDPAGQRWVADQAENSPAKIDKE